MAKVGMWNPNNQCVGDPSILLETAYDIFKFLPGQYLLNTAVLSAAQAEVGI